MLCQINSLVAVLLLCIVAIDAAVPPHRYLTAGLPEGQQLFSVIERSNNVAESERTDCCGPGYTFDKCASSRLCQYPRFCINEHTQSTCGYSYEEPCHCVPIDMVECVHPSQCVTPYETCAYLPHDKPYCYSYDIVKLNGSFTEYTGGDCCGGGPTTPPPSTTYAPPSYAPPSYASPSYGPPSYAPPSYAPPSDAPPSYSPPTVAPPSNAPPSNAPPSNAPSYAPPSDTPPSTVAPPGSPPPSLSPWPSQRPVTPVPLPSQKGPNYGTSPSPSPTEGGRTGDQCEPVTRPCISYRECVDANTRQPCTSSCTGVCINAIVCKCSSDCFDGEVCAGAENQPGRYCFSPDVIASLPWAIEYECTTGMTGDPCTDDSACKDGRTCVQGGRSECLSGQALCGVDRPPCQAGDEYCYCNAIKSCTCTDNCDDSEVCCKTAYGQMCISRESARGNANLTQVPCDQNLPPAGSAYALADSVPPYREDSSPTPVTTDSSGTPDDTGDDDSNGDTSSDTVCVDARALSHIPRDELVYTEHVLSTVLCDRSGSCATPGHIVLYRGTAMMMKTYCKVAGCSYRKLFVNSPKYRRRLQIPSNTHSLAFTTFAARFATTAEELVLSTIVHAGL